MRPDTAGKNSFLFFWYCCLVTRILALSSLVLHRNGWWWWWSGALANRSRCCWEIRMPVVVVDEGGCIFMHSSKIKMNILFDLIPAWLGGYKKSIFKHASNAPLRGIIKSLESCNCLLRISRTLSTHNHEWVGDWMCAIRWWCWLREERLWLCKRIQFSVLAAGVRLFKE